MKNKVLLICSECLSRNYTIDAKSDSKIPNEMKKFCPKCGKHTVHKISK